MHGRTRKQMYMGEADWETLKDVADALTIPFVGNGDVTTPEKAKAMLEDVGADAVMVGRAALGNPWIIKDMVDRKSTRLNSSHVSISYAVFCLKKKKKTKAEITQ